MSIFSRIEQRLAALGISQREASRRAELGESYIRDLSRNAQQSPRVDDLRALAGALETNIEWLITGAGDPNQKADADAAVVISIMPSLDAKRRAELATYAKFLAEQKKREAGE